MVIRVNKLMTLLTAVVAMFMVSCGTLTPEGKLQAAQKSFLASVELLHEAREAGELKGVRLAKAQKIVKRISVSIKAWRHSILTDKANGIEVSDRADLARVVKDAISQLAQYHIKKKLPKKEEED